MRTQKTDTWIQLVTAIAVIAGLALVIWELQQTRDLAFTQLAHGNMDAMSQDRSAVYGEELGEVLATACFSPEELASPQAFALNAYFQNQMTRIARVRLENEQAGMPTPWRSLSRGPLHEILSFPQGRVWVQHHPFLSEGFYDPDISNFVNEELRADVESCASKIDRMTHGNSSNDA